MIQNKIVIHYLDGRLEKGITSDFFPNKEHFHVMPATPPAGVKMLEIRITDLKAVFFVKDFTGSPDYIDKKDFEPGKNVVGRKLSVVFKDGELMVGTTTGYQPDRPGFFIVPADPKSNVERCFVITKATREVKFV
jgi:hypothetical protein